MDDPFLMGTTSSISMQSLGKIVQRAPAVGAKMWCLSYFAGPTGTWVRLAVQNFTSIGAEGWECGPKNIKNFHFLVKIVGGDSLDRFRKFFGVLYA